MESMESDELNHDQIRSILLSLALKLACDKLCKIGQLSAGDNSDEVRTLSESELYVDLIESAYPELFDSHNDRDLRKYSEHLDFEFEKLEEAINLDQPYDFRWHND